MADEPTLRQEDTWAGPRSEGPGSRIGPFLLLRQLGEGGFGVVFEAEQEQPVRRKVALKILKLGMDTREVIARFDAERQALALMEHPHIARVLDAGATDSGRPYFVMELVDGVPIAQYCDEHGLDIGKRLQLFDQVCAAVQHAHTKGVVHRDLKPGNVLVSTQDGSPLAKVIDFGIAKATRGRLTEQTLMTELNQVMGTPLYMSPEQAEGSADIDTRSDIYSLGVILYELLTGSTPVQSSTLRSAVFAEIQRIICEVEPPRPSVRLAQDTSALSGVAARRGTEPRKLARTVKGELDWIVMKALEKDRNRRYETANGLAMDVRRFLAAEPILAAPPSASYRLQKFVRRNKGAVAAGALVAASLLIGIAAFAWQAQIAQARAYQLQQVANFQADMLGQIDATGAGIALSNNVEAKYADALAQTGMPVGERAAQAAAFASQWQRINATDTARELIDSTMLRPAASAIDKKFRAQPEVDATLKQTLANVYVELGMLDAAEPLQRDALATRTRVLGERDPLVLESSNRQGELLMYQGQYDGAEPYFRRVLAARRSQLGEDHTDTIKTMSDLGELLRLNGDLKQAEPLARAALAKSRRVRGNDDLATLEAISNMGLLLDDAGKLDEARGFQLEAMQRSRRLLGSEHPQTLAAIDNYGALMFQKGDLAQADRYLAESLATRRRVLGEEHPETINSINSMAVVRGQQKRLFEAEAYYREAVAKTRRVLGADHPDTLQLVDNLGVFLADQGKLAEAEPFVRESVSKNRQQLGPEHPRTLAAQKSLIGILVANGSYADAERLALEMEPAARKVFVGENLRRLPKLLIMLGEARTGLHRYAEAERTLLEARELAVHTRVPRHADVRDVNSAIIALYTAWDRVSPGKGYDHKAAKWQQLQDSLAAMKTEDIPNVPTPTAAP